MSNQEVLTLVNACDEEFRRIERIIDVLTSTNPAVPFLTKYAVIKACGTLEQAFKVLISDFSCHGQSTQVRSYINSTFRESSINPSLENICKSLKRFDEQWNNNFKNLLNTNADHERIKSSISSLNTARNNFAHGGNPTITFNSVVEYFSDAKLVIDFIEQSLV